MLGLTGIPATAFASSDTSKDEFEIEYYSDDSWEYTYEESGKSFKVEEEYNPETGVTESKIYTKKDNEYVLKTLQSTYIDDDNDVVIETVENGKFNSETINIEEVNVEQDNQGASKSSNEFSPTSWELTPWQFSRTVEYTSSQFVGMTIGAIRTAVSAVFGVPTWLEFVMDAAQEIFVNNLDSVFYRTNHWYRNIEGTTILAGIKEYQYIFTDSSLSTLIGSNVKIDCADDIACE